MNINPRQSNRSIGGERLWIKREKTVLAQKRKNYKKHQKGKTRKIYIKNTKW